MDFKITTDGDLTLSGSVIKECVNMDLVVQKSMCIVASVTHDWFYDHIGCDLEQIIGKPMNNETISEGVSLIYSSLYKTNMFEDNGIKVEAKKIGDEYVGFNVQINDENKKYNYYIIEVFIDIIKGIEVKLGGEYECLY